MTTRDWCFPVPDLYENDGSMAARVHIVEYMGVTGTETGRREGQPPITRTVMTQKPFILCIGEIKLRWKHICNAFVDGYTNLKFYFVSKISFYLLSSFIGFVEDNVTIYFQLVIILISVTL